MSISRKSILEQTFLTTKSYEDVVKMSEKSCWAISDVLSPEDRLDFSRPFLPYNLLALPSLPFLSDKELLSFNHVLSYSYLHLFYFVEEFIIALMIEEIQSEIYGDPQAIRSLSRFTDEEVKHQLLFQKFKELFNQSFGSDCEELDSAVEVAQALLENSNIAVLIVTLHLEVVTQSHYTGSIQEEGGSDSLFAKLLYYHWKEECQHAQIDLLKLQKYADQSSLTEVRSGFQEYCEIMKTFKGFLLEQSQMNIRSLQKKLGRIFSEAEFQQLVTASLNSLSDMFITAGLEHRQFISCLKKFIYNVEERLGELKKSLE